MPLFRLLLFVAVCATPSPAAEETLRCASTLSAGGSPTRAKIAAATKIVTARSTTGHRDAVAIFATFTGSVPEGTAVPSYASSLFDPDRPGSFTHFYRAMSFGRLTFHGTALPIIYTSGSPPSSYGPGEYGRFVLEILQKADPDNDFGRFDNDGPDGIPNSGDDDGYADVVFVNLLPNNIPEGFISRGATGIGNLGFSDDFVTDDPAAQGDRIRIRGNSGTTQVVRSFAHAVGSMTHEYGHLLGLPDLYDLSSTSAPDESPELDSAGIGAWGLMGRGALGWNGDDGPNPFSAWEREQLGWTDVVTVTHEMHGVVIDDVETGGAIYKIPVAENEYFLIESRQRGGGYYDRNIPGEGLLIWHITTFGRNDTEERKMVDLECADGRFTDAGFPLGRIPDPVKGGDNLDFWAHDESYAKAHAGNLGDATDPFDGFRFTELSLTTNPNGYDERDYWENGASGVAITDIRRDGSRMIADFQPNAWSGHIASDVIWSGIVIVTGDITLEPGGSLLIRPGTIVEVNPSDDRQEGDDPSRIEFTILGRLTVAGEGNTPVRFTSSTGGPADWYGIAVHPGSPVDLGKLQVEGATAGVFWAGGERIAIQEVSLVDAHVVLPFAPELAIRGNGDQRANPGELISISSKLQNRTFRTFSSLFIKAWSSDPNVRLYGQREASQSFDNGLAPGDIVALPLRLRLLVPSNPSQGMVYSIVLDITADGEAWRDTLKVTVEGTDHTPPLISYFTVIPHFTPVGSPVRVEATLLDGGTISSAEAEISRAGDGTVVGQIALTPVGDGTFSGTWIPPIPASFTVSLRVSDDAGNVERAERAKAFTSIPFVRSSNLLLVEDNSSEIGDLLRALHISYDLWNTDERGLVDAGVMAGYGSHTGGIVIWNAPLEPSDILTIESYLDSEGRLLITGEGIGYDLQLSWPEQAGQFLMDRFHISVAGVRGVKALTSSSGTIAGISSFITGGAFAFFDSCRCGSGVTKVTPAGQFLTTLAPSEVRGGFTFLNVLPTLICSCGCGGLTETNVAFIDLITPHSPAVPIFFDQEGRPVAVRVETDKTKIVYLGFRLASITDPAQATTFLSDILDFLRAPITTAVEEEVISFPDRYTLSPNVPNPFNATTLITYHLPILPPLRRGDKGTRGQGEPLPASPPPQFPDRGTGGQGDGGKNLSLPLSSSPVLPIGGVVVRLGVWDVAGRLVRVLVDGMQNPGEYQVIWDGKDERGRLVASGVYFYRLEVGGHAVTETRRMMLVK